MAETSSVADFVTALRRCGLPETPGWESLAATARILRNRGLERVLVVSDPYHSLRARETAREVGLDAYASPTLTSPVDGWSEWKRMFREAAGVSVLL